MIKYTRGYELVQKLRSKKSKEIKKDVKSIIKITKK